MLSQSLSECQRAKIMFGLRLVLKAHYIGVELTLLLGNWLEALTHLDN